MGLDGGTQQPDAGVEGAPPPCHVPGNNDDGTAFLAIGEDSVVNTWCILDLTDRGAARPWRAGQPS